MNELEEQQFEAELRRMVPARLPEDFRERLEAAKFEACTRKTIPSPRATHWTAWRWLAPALAVLVAGSLLMTTNFTATRSVSTPLAAAGGLKADDVQVDQELVSSFDVVAKLPGGQPVRFRCREMRDQLKVSDKVRGVEIETSSPRVEVTPVRFETY